VLRKCEKDRKAGTPDELKRLEQENKELAEKLQREIEERKNEIEYWVAERATMRKMIDQLESEKVDGAMDAPVREVNDKEMSKVKKKLKSKLKFKDVELKSKEKQIQDLRDELSRLKQTQTQLELKSRDQNSRLVESEERLKYAQ